MQSEAMRLALSTRFVLWMVALDALPGDKSIAPMAQEAPVWGRGSPVIAHMHHATL